MNISAIVTAVVVVGGVGLFLGIFLGIASIVFKVAVDEKEEAVLGVLPGNNCGGCGYPGCSGLAARSQRVRRQSMPVQSAASQSAKRLPPSWALRRESLSE